MPHPALPLRLTQRGTDVFLTLGDINITPFVAADGLTIDYTGDTLGPDVTIRFGRGALDLAFDIDLLEELLAVAKARA